MTLKEIAIQVIKDNNKALSAKEIWKIAEQKGLLKKIVAKGKSPYSTFTSILYTDCKRPNSTFIISSEGRPKKFTLRNG